MISGRNRTITKQEDRDRAVTDMIAFILVFATILMSVALLSTVGFQAMTDFQEGEQSQNAGRSMVSLTSNFNDVMRYDGVTKRDGTISLRQGTLRIGDNGTQVNITSDDGSIDENHTLGTFAYESDSQTVAYEGGGLIRATDSGSAVVRRPELTCRPEQGTAIVSLVKVESTPQSIQSSGSLEVSMEENEDNTTREVYTAGDVTVDVESEYDTAWEDVLGGDSQWTTSDEDWKCEEIDRVVVTIVPVEITY